MHQNTMRFKNIYDAQNGKSEWPSVVVIADLLPTTGAEDTPGLFFTLSPVPAAGPAAGGPPPPREPTVPGSARGYLFRSGTSRVPDRHGRPTKQPDRRGSDPAGGTRPADRCHAGPRRPPRPRLEGLDRARATEAVVGADRVHGPGGPNQSPRRWNVPLGHALARRPGELHHRHLPRGRRERAVRRHRAVRRRGRHRGPGLAVRVARRLAGRDRHDGHARGPRWPDGHDRAGGRDPRGDGGVLRARAAAVHRQARRLPGDSGGGADGGDTDRPAGAAPARSAAPAARPVRRHLVDAGEGERTSTAKSAARSRSSGWRAATSSSSTSTSTTPATR